MRRSFCFVHEFNHLHGGALNIGMTHYYFGDGKGKTTTLLGLIIRALGHNLNPLLIQFLKRHEPNRSKGGFFIGEIHFLKQFIKIKQFGNGEFVKEKTCKDQEIIRTAQKGLQYASKAVKSGKYDLVALDEVVNAISMNLIELEDLIQIIEQKPDHVEIVCTGMMFYKKLREVADYVVGYNSIEHPFKKGVMARKGIEY